MQTFLKILVPLAVLGLAPCALALQTNVSYSVDFFDSLSGTRNLAADSRAGTYDVGLEKHSPEGGLPYFAAVLASANGLHASNSAALENLLPNPNDNFGVSFTSSSTASVRYDDCIVTGTGTAPVATRLSVLLEGAVSTTKVLYGTAGTAPYDLSADGLVVTSLFVDNAAVIPYSQFVQQNRYAGAGVSGTGVLSDYEGGRKVFTSDLFMVTPNQPFSVEFGLTTGATVGYNAHTAGRVRSELFFGDTYSFATDRPVLDLPDGYTFNSASANIVDNRFNPVPEPAPLAALALGALVLVRRRRRG